jgi:hypothetical protein
MRITHLLGGNKSSIASSSSSFFFQIGSMIAEEEEPGSRLERKEQLLEKIEQGGTTTPKKRYLSPGGGSTWDQGTGAFVRQYLSSAHLDCLWLGTVPSSVRSSCRPYWHPVRQKPLHQLSAWVLVLSCTRRKHSPFLPLAQLLEQD